MNHIAEHTWADMARGVASDHAKQQAGAHLASGCSDCHAAFNLWQSFAGLAANEPNCAPPNDLVRLAKLAFASQSFAHSEPGILATLIFDSLSNPLPVGIRSAAGRARQVVYEADGLTVDLRLERLANTGRVFTFGQVLDRLDPAASMVKANIFLWNAPGHLVAATEANDFGEFQFEFELQDWLRISIEAAGRKTLRIPLGKLS